MGILKKHYFTCPCCNTNKITFISDEARKEIFENNQTIQVVLSEDSFPAAYRELFISRLCTKCQENIFGKDTEYTKAVDVDETENTDELEANIRELYENAR